MTQKKNILIFNVLVTHIFIKCYYVLKVSEDTR